MAMYVDGAKYLEFMLQSFNQSFDVGGVVLNGYFICFLILQTLLVHVPLLIALVAGDMIAGEANLGTLRFLLTKPVSRWKLIVAKFMATSVYTILLLSFMAALSLFLSLFIFGKGDLLIMKSDMVVILDKADIMWRYAGAFGFAAISMLTVASLAFLFSVFADNAIGPIISAMSVVIVFTILTSMDIPLFNASKPYLFTNHMLNWKGFFENPVDYGELLKSTLVLLGHIAIFVSLSIEIFRRKDILS
jgi:ABC-2 type transport system permease protein